MSRESLPESVSTLPVLALSDEIAMALRAGNVLLSAEPGAGKSTGLPLALLLNEVCDGKIILLEPRRLAARSVAERLALHLGEVVGQRVGLRMRSDTRVSKNTRLEVVTEGVLTRLLQADPGLEGVGLVIFDEFHERSLHADLGLAMCLEVQQAWREDLRILLMSATLDTDLLQTQLSGIKQFHCSVKQHPIEIFWLGEQSGSIEARVGITVRKALLEQSGDVLVFLPGVAEINRSAALLKPQLDAAVTVHLLHSGVSKSAQLNATAASSPASRRVILATSLAETSLTIDGVKVVIDTGLERRSRTENSTGGAAAGNSDGQSGECPATCWAGRAHHQRSLLSFLD